MSWSILGGYLTGSESIEETGEYGRSEIYREYIEDAQRPTEWALAGVDLDGYYDTMIHYETQSHTNVTPTTTFSISSTKY